jgi:hypothetical protein
VVQGGHELYLPKTPKDKSDDLFASFLSHTITKDKTSKYKYTKTKSRDGYFYFLSRSLYGLVFGFCHIYNKYLPQEMSVVVGGQILQRKLHGHLRTKPHSLED